MDGNDRRPGFTPDIGWGGRLFLVVLVLAIVFAGLGWIFI
jgi:hypothetical protein